MNIIAFLWVEKKFPFTLFYLFIILPHSLQVISIYRKCFKTLKYVTFKGVDYNNGDIVDQWVKAAYQKLDDLKLSSNPRSFSDLFLSLPLIPCQSLLSYLKKVEKIPYI